MAYTWYIVPGICTVRLRAVVPHNKEYQVCIHILFMKMRRKTRATTVVSACDRGIIPSLQTFSFDEIIDHLAAD